VRIWKGALRNSCSSRPLEGEGLGVAGGEGAVYATRRNGRKPLIHSIA